MRTKRTTFRRKPLGSTTTPDTTNNTYMVASAFPSRVPKQAPPVPTVVIAAHQETVTSGTSLVSFSCLRLVDMCAVLVHVQFCGPWRPSS